MNAVRTFKNDSSYNQWLREQRAKAHGSDRCEYCNLMPATQLHHLTYERVLDDREQVRNVKNTCRPCHEIQTRGVTQEAVDAYNAKLILNKGAEPIVLWDMYLLAAPLVWAKREFQLEPIMKVEIRGVEFSHVEVTGRTGQKMLTFWRCATDDDHARTEDLYRSIVKKERFGRVSAQVLKLPNKAPWIGPYMKCAMFKGQCRSSLQWIPLYFTSEWLVTTVWPDGNGGWWVNKAAGTIDVEQEFRRREPLWQMLTSLLPNADKK